MFRNFEEMRREMEAKRRVAEAMKRAEKAAAKDTPDSIAKKKSMIDKMPVGVLLGMLEIGMEDDVPAAEDMHSMFMGVVTMVANVSKYTEKYGNDAQVWPVHVAEAFVKELKEGLDD